MKKIVITKSNKQIFIEGPMINGIKLNINKDETVDEVDATDVSKKEWEKFKEEKNADEFIEKIKKEK